MLCCASQVAPSVDLRVGQGLPVEALGGKDTVVTAGSNASHVQAWRLLLLMCTLEGFLGRHAARHGVLGAVGLAA